MKMKVEDALLGRLPGRGNQVHALRADCRFDGMANLEDSFHEPGAQLSVCGPEICNMDSGDHQGVARRRRFQREERDPMLTLTYDLGRRVTASDRAELTPCRSRRQPKNPSRMSIAT